MPLFLVTSVCDKGVYANSFRVVEAESNIAIAEDILKAPYHWKSLLNNTELWWDLMRYEDKYGEPLDWTAEELLDKIDETHRDGDSRNQLRIVTIQPFFWDETVWVSFVTSSRQFMIKDLTRCLLYF